MGGGEVIDHAVLQSVAEQMMNGAEVRVDDRLFRVSRTGAQRLRTVRFLMGGQEYQAIEQNPEKPSQWGKLAREGRRVVQFRDLLTQKYVAVAVDGKVKEYGR
jgi:hypothetical protein